MIKKSKSSSIKSQLSFRRVTFGGLTCLLGLLLASCHPTPYTKSATGTGGGNGVQKESKCAPGVECLSHSDDGTDTATYLKVCGPNQEVNHVSGTWRHVRKFTSGKQVISDMTISAEAMKLTVANSCTQEGVGLLAQATVNIHLAAGSISIISNDHETHESTLPSKATLSCSSKIFTGQYKYTFKGKCLVLTGSGITPGQLILLPVR